METYLFDDVPATVQAEQPKSPTKDRARELKAGIDTSIDDLANAVDAVRASATFQAYLDVQAKFHSYSWHNSILIMMQKPDAVRVAGFNTWRKLGRFVRKGERGIMIFAPCPFKREEKSESGETATVDGIFFKPVYVFDLSQTDGKELPAVESPLILDERGDILAMLERVAVKRGIALKVEALNGPLGYATDGGSTIAIDGQFTTGQRAKTLAHELAHCALHFGKTDQATKLTRDMAELEAESIAYVVCRHFGLDTTVRSSAYIALWNGDSKGLRASLERIAKTARAIIEDVDNLDDATIESAVAA